MAKVLTSMLDRVPTLRSVVLGVLPYSSLLSVCLPAALFILISYGSRLPLLETRTFDPDEFEHLHVAWLIANGSIPYRDFFEHHTPWFHFALAPFFSFFDVNSKVEDAIAFIFLARRLMWLLAGVILLFTWRLGTSWRDARVGWIGMLLLINTAVYLTTTVEIRPDLPALVFWLACLATALHAIQSPSNVCSAKAWHFAWSGVFLGAAIMTTQKMLFAVPGFGLGLAWYILDSRVRGTRRDRLVNVGYAMMGFVAPIVFTLGYFYAKNGLTEFLEYNVFLNARWKEHFTPYQNLRQLVYQNPYLAIFGAAGLSQVLFSLLRRRNRLVRGDFILLPATAGVIGGLFVIPVPGLQYYVIFLPLLALFAGAFLVASADKLAGLRNCISIRRWALLVVLCAIGVLTALLIIGWGLKSPWGTAPVIMYWFSALVVALILLSVRMPSLALAVFLVAVSVPSLKQMQGVFRFRNTAQINEIRYIMENTGPTDTVMDGFTGTGAFRPHAHFYFMPHYGLQLMMTADDWGHLLKNLQSGRVSPKLVIFDKDLRSAPATITAFLRDHYEPLGVGDIWRRK